MLLKKAIVQEKGCNFAALRQMSLYVLQFWGVARFVESQSLKIGHLVCMTDHFDLIIPSLNECAGSNRIAPIYPMP